MGDKPILFSGPMVRALIAGTNTQTRRSMFKKEPPADGRRAKFHRITGKWEWRTKYDNFGGVIAPQPRIAVGDRLYVREHWRTFKGLDSLAPRDLVNNVGLDIEFIADGTNRNFGKHRQAMHMPRWASRLTLTVTDVRVERLHGISPGDALAEGIQSTDHWDPKSLDGRPFEEKWWDDATFWADYPPLVYRALWEAINGAGSWEANPWVAAYTFTVQMGNIDQLEAA